MRGPDGRLVGEGKPEASWNKPWLNWASTAEQAQAEELGWRKQGGDREVGSPPQTALEGMAGGTGREVGVWNVSWGSDWLWGLFSASEWERIELIP